MKPLRLTLEAFGPYAGCQDLNFADLKDQSFFLIHGPTGAGKTSILDGICYALYGETSGGLRETKDLRSHFALAEVPTRVRFEFMLGQRQFRVERSPEQQVPKQRGDGTKKQPCTANLWELVQGKDVLLAVEKPAQVDAKVAELVGFEAAQFRQVVLLPQGRFQEFMLAGATERQAILQALFQTARYARITEALIEEERCLKEGMRANQVETRQKLTMAGAKTIFELPGLIQAASARVGELTSEEQAAGASLNQASTLLMEGIRAAELLAECKAAQAHLESLQKKSRVMEACRTELDRARRCEPLLPTIQRLEEIQVSLQEQEAEETRLSAALAIQEEAFLRAETTLAEAEQHWVRREELRWIILRLKDLEPKLEALEVARKEVREAALGRGRLGDLAEEQKRNLETRRQDLWNQKALMQETRTEAAQEAGREGLLFLIRKRRAQKEELERSQDEVKRAEGSHKFAQEALQAARKTVQAARERHRFLYERRLAFHTAKLAVGLEEGQPCPVCGSEAHPHLAVSAVELPEEKDLRLAMEHQEDAETVLARAQDTAASCAAALEVAHARRQDLVAALGGHADITMEGLTVIETRHREELNRSRAAEAELPSAERRLALAEETRNQAETKLSETNQRLSELMIREAGAKARMLLLEAELLQELRVPGALSTRRHEAELELEASEAHLAAARAAREPSQTVVLEARAALKAHGAHLDAARLELANLAKIFTEALATAHFHDRADFDLARRTTEEMRTLAKSLETHTAELSGAVHRMEQASLNVKGLTEPDLPTLQLIRDEAHTRFAQAAEALGGVLAEQAALERLEQDLTRLTKELALQERRHRAVASLASAARGDEGNRVSFERFVQAFILDEVLVFSSERLRRMSKQRYGFRRAVTSPEKHRGGLQLEIDDSHTGRARAVSSLSGGEGFQASLALALGLSDVVQRHAGGIRLDTVFIDEGFGSLDAEALDLALLTLEELNQGGRLVGLISHLEAVKARIPARLEVIPSPAGSHARFRVE